MSKDLEQEAPLEEQQDVATNTPESEATLPDAESAAPEPTQEQEQAAPPEPTWVAKLRDAVPDLPDDEGKALEKIKEQYQQFQQYSPYLNAYLQHAQEFSKYLQERQQKSAEKQQDGPWYQQYWNPPEYDPSWQYQVAEDENGNLKAINGASPDVVPKYQAYLRWRQGQFQKMGENFPQYIEPMARHIAAEEARKIVQEQLSRQQEMAAANQFTQTNSEWLYERDGEGRIQTTPIYDPQTGSTHHMRKLSPWGQRFKQLVEEEAAFQQRHGINNVERQKEVAMRQILAEYQAAQVSQSPQQTANKKFLDEQNPATKKRQAANTVPADTPVNSENLMQEMLKAAKQEGLLQTA